MCHISGDPFKIKDFRKGLCLLSRPHGGKVHKDNIYHTSTSGIGTAVEDYWIPLSATVEEEVNFLAMLFNTARSALSAVFTLQNNQTFETHPLVTRFMKGELETRPSLPPYSETWDVNVVLG